MSFLWLALIIGLTFLLFLLLFSEEEKGAALKPPGLPEQTSSQEETTEDTSQEDSSSPVVLEVQAIPLSSSEETSSDEYLESASYQSSSDEFFEDVSVEQEGGNEFADAGEVLPTGEVMTVTAQQNLAQQTADEERASADEASSTEETTFAKEETTSAESSKGAIFQKTAEVSDVEEPSEITAQDISEEQSAVEGKTEETSIDSEEADSTEVTAQTVSTPTTSKESSPEPTFSEVADEAPPPSPRKGRKQPTGQRSPLGHYSQASMELVGRWLDIPVHRLEEVLVSIRRQTAYRHFELEKVHSDETRLIQAPIEPLRLLQRRILERLVYTIPCSNAAHGAVPGRSVVTNAAAHLPSAREVLNLDLRNAFPSVRFARVRGVFRPLTRELLKKTGQLDAPVPSETNLKEETAHLLTALTTSPQVEKNGRTVYVLPQGAPTSGALLNLVCRDLDRKIFKICKQFSSLKLRYTRYLDDLTLSSPEEIPAEVRREVEHAILKNGFKDNTAKTKHLREGNVLQICGLRLEGRKLEVSPQIVSRCAIRLEESRHRGESIEEEWQHRTAVFGIINFFRMVYGPRIPDSIAAPYKEYRSNRNLGREKEAQEPHALPWSPRGAEEQTGLSLLAQWLDVSVEELEFVKQMVEEGEAYLRWSIPKRNGQHRQIMTPYYELKKIQARLLRRLLYRIPVSDAAHGFVPARSIVTNAYAHSHRDHLLNIDLKDAFPSVSLKRVKTTLHIGLGTLFKKYGVRCSREVREELVSLIALLTTFDDQLPQGAPTSGVLLNLAAEPLDKRLYELLGEMGDVRYTRYADDLTFSSKEPLTNKQIQAIKKTIRNSGFRWNPEKTKVIDRTRGQRVEVCGLLVDGDQLRIPREKLKKYRSILRRTATQIPAGLLDEETRLQIHGILGFVHMVYGKIPSPLVKPLAQVTEVHPEARPPEKFFKETPYLPFYSQLG